MSKRISLKKRHILDLPYDCLLYVTDFFSLPSEANCFLRTCKTFHRLLNDISVYCGCSNVEFHFTHAFIATYHRKPGIRVEPGSATIPLPDSRDFRVVYNGLHHNMFGDRYLGDDTDESDKNGQSLTEFIISMMTASFYPYVKNVVLGERLVIHAGLAMTFLLRFPFLKSVTIFNKPRKYGGGGHIIDPFINSHHFGLGNFSTQPPPFGLDLGFTSTNDFLRELNPLNPFRDGPGEWENNVDSPPPKKPAHFGDFLFGTILPKFKLLESISFVLANELAPLKFFPFFGKLENIKVLSFSLEQCGTLDDEVLLKMKKLSEVHIHGLVDDAFWESPVNNQVATFIKIKSLKFVAKLDKLFFHCDSLVVIRTRLKKRSKLRDNFFSETLFHSEVWNLLYSFQSLGCCKVYIDPCCTMKLIGEHHSISGGNSQKGERIELTCLCCLSCMFCETIPSPPTTKPPECRACGKIACADCLTGCDNCGNSMCKPCFQSSESHPIFSLQKRIMRFKKEIEKLEKQKRVLEGREEGKGKTTSTLCDERDDDDDEKMKCCCEQLRNDSLKWCAGCKSRGMCAVKTCSELKCEKCSTECTNCRVLTCNSHYQQQEQKDITQSDMNVICCVCRRGGCLECLAKECSKCSLKYHAICGGDITCEARSNEPQSEYSDYEIHTMSIEDLLPPGCHNRARTHGQGPFAEYCGNCIKSADKKQVVQHLSLRVKKNGEGGEAFHYCSSCDAIFCAECIQKCHFCEHVCGGLGGGVEPPCIKACDVCAQWMCMDCMSSVVKEICEICEVSTRIFKCCKKCEKTIKKRSDLAECRGCNQICCQKCSKKCQDCQALRCFRKKQFLIPVNNKVKSFTVYGNRRVERVSDCLVRCWGCSKAVCSGCVQVHSLFGVLCSQCSTECEKDEWKDLFKK